MDKTYLLIFIIVFALSVTLDSIKIPKLEKNYDKYRKKFVDKNEFQAGGLSSLNIYHKRKEIYNKNINEINRHNRLYNLGKVSFYLGENLFTDWSDDDFKKLLAKSVKNTKLRYESINKKKAFKKRQSLQLPIVLNYVKQGLVTEVKDQLPKKCSSCTIFSTIATIESQYAMLTGELVNLSEQFLVDCGINDQICNDGGNIQEQFEYLKQKSIKKFPRTKDYIYKGKKGTCNKNFNISGVYLEVTGYFSIPTDSQKKILEALIKYGPLSAYIYANGEFKQYEGGVINSTELCSGIPNHAVTIVGYDKESYLVKNSFGKRWGEKMSRKECNFRENLIYTTIKTQEDVIYYTIEPSTVAGKLMTFTLINDLNFNMSLYWIKSDYSAVLDSIIQPGQSYFKNSFENYAWVLANKVEKINKCITFSLGYSEEFKRPDSIVNISKLSYFCEINELKITEPKNLNLTNSYEIWEASDYPKYFKKMNDVDWYEYHHDRLMFRFKQVETGGNYVILYDEARANYVKLDNERAIQGLEKENIKYFLNLGTWKNPE